MQILNEVVPTAKRIAVLVNPDDPNAASQLRYAEDAARELRFELHPIAPIRAASEIFRSLGMKHAINTDLPCVATGSMVMPSRSANSK
jgi:ABC-type uncharacterized transport system substrate-binding protein